MPAFSPARTLRKDPLDRCEAWVLGGGISGITTALVLQALGLRTAIITEYMSLQAQVGNFPHIATDYAMASAYPHNLRIANLPGISDTSQAVFSSLSRMETSGITQYKLFEVFEFEPEKAPLASRRMQFQEFDGAPGKLKTSLNPPARPGAKYLWGWTFDTYFADMPLYLTFLWSLFKEQGGVVELARVHCTDLVHLAQGRVVANCLGLGAVSLVEDTAPAVVVRGRQVFVPDGPPCIFANRAPVAYNYTPPAEVFPRADGNPEYVHFFPRSDGWILGQTREPGIIDKQGRWIGDPVASEECMIGNCSIPTPILDLNELLLSNWLGWTVRKRNLIGRVGYRYYRDPEGSGARLEVEERGNALLIHNYGHGGSGITMSWGCAIECARLLNKHDNQRRRTAAGPGHLARLITSLVEKST